MRQFLILGAVAVVAVACGGVSSLGAGTGSTNGKDGGTGGVTTGTGGSSSTGGKPGAGGDVGAGGSLGTGGAGGGGGGACKTAGECAVPQICKVCPDGRSACAQAACVGGKCEVVYPSCSVGGTGGAGGGSGTCDPAYCPVTDPRGKPCCLSTIGPCGEDYGMGCVVANGAQCVADTDCPVPPTPCMLCPDGSCRTPITRCLQGVCGTTFLACASTTTTWWDTCGPPVCSTNPAPSGLPPCAPTDKAGNPCPSEGVQCDTGNPCAGPLTCSTSDPSPNTCPISRARYKQDIEYVSREERAQLASDIQSIPLVRYRYKDGPEREHLGFIIEDIEPSPSVDSRHDQVDLYGYTSMAVAALQQQHAEIEALKRQVKRLEAALGAGRTK